jgi:hypothetical protein
MAAAGRQGPRRSRLDVADDNAIVTIAEAVTRIGRHEWPMRPTPTVVRFLEEFSEALGIEFDRQRAGDRAWPSSAH